MTESDEKVSSFSSPGWIHISLGIRFLAMYCSCSDSSRSKYFPSLVDFDRTQILCWEFPVNIWGWVCSRRPIAWPSIGCAGRDANHDRSSNTLEHRPQDAPWWKINQQFCFVTDMYPPRRENTVLYASLFSLWVWASGSVTGERLEVISGPQSYFLSLPGSKVVFACPFSPLNEEVDYFKIFPKIWNISSTFSKDCYLWRVVRCCKTKRVL